MIGSLSVRFYFLLNFLWKHDFNTFLKEDEFLFLYFLHLIMKKTEHFLFKEMNVDYFWIPLFTWGITLKKNTFKDMLQKVEPPIFIDIIIKVIK